MGLKERLETEELVFSMPAGESGKLFGSITNTMIADELNKKGTINLVRFVLFDKNSLSVHEKALESILVD